MSSPARSPPEGVPAALLFEDNSVVVEEVKREVRDEDGGMRRDEIHSDLRDDYPPSPSSSPDEKTSLSPEGGDSRRTSTTPPAGSKSKSKPAKKEPQLIGHLPRAEDNAHKTFVEIPENHYQYQSLGRSREAGESMTCDCQYEHGQFGAVMLYSPYISAVANVCADCWAFLRRFGASQG